MKRGAVELAVRRDLRALKPEVRRSGMAASAVALAQLLDGEFVGVCRSCREDVTMTVEASARDAAAVARELRATLASLREVGGDSAAESALVARLSTPLVDEADDGPADAGRPGRRGRRAAGDAADALAARRGRRRAGA